MTVLECPVWGAQRAGQVVHARPKVSLLARALCSMSCQQCFLPFFPHFWRGIEQSAPPELLTIWLGKDGQLSAASGGFTFSVP